MRVDRFQLHLNYSDLVFIDLANKMPCKIQYVYTQIYYLISKHRLGEQISCRNQNTILNLNYDINLA